MPSSAAWPSRRHPVPRQQELKSNSACAAGNCDLPAENRWFCNRSTNRGCGVGSKGPDRHNQAQLATLGNRRSQSSTAAHSTRSPDADQRPGADSRELAPRGDSRGKKPDGPIHRGRPVDSSVRVLYAPTDNGKPGQRTPRNDASARAPARILHRRPMKGAGGSI